MSAPDTVAGNSVVEVEDVTLRFKGVTAINGVSFTVGEQELFAIIGPNGAGKTSIFNVLSGVYRPQEGRVQFLGEDILGRRPHLNAAAGMARTFQNIELFENLTVIDNLMLGRAHARQVRDARGRRSGWAPPGAASWPTAPPSRTSSTSWSWRSTAASRWACCPTASRSGSSSAGRWPCSPGCCCSTSRWPA